MTSVAILIPAYNEEVSIASVVLLAQQYGDEVIVIDDGSKDRTASISRKADATVLSHNTNMGKGVALKTGFEYAKDYDIIVTIDGDGQHDPAQIPRLIEPIIDNKADVVNGSRYMNDQESDTPTYRRVGQIILDKSTNIASKEDLTDTQSGFRAFSSTSFDCFHFNPEGYGIESDMIVEAANNNLRIMEVNITVRYDVRSNSDNPVVHGVSVLLRILELLRFNRPLYYFGVTGIILIFFGLVIYLIVAHSIYYTNIYYTAIGLLVIIVGVILVLSGIITDTLDHYRNN